MVPPAAPFRVLLVDDEPVIRKLVGTILAGRGVEVLCVPDGAKAVAEALRFKPDLVLLDVVLPGLDGFAICRLLRADEALKGVPIYMLTAKAKSADHASARRAGATGYIEKPFRAERLRGLVKELRLRPMD